MEQKTLQQMQELRDRCTVFLKDVTAPMKKQHGENVEKYIENFIKFPGGFSLVAVFFGASELVKDHTIAIVGIALIVLSLIMALNIFRVQINNDKPFLGNILKLEMPMVEFGTQLTKFSREETGDQELQDSYNKLQESYRLNSINIKSKEADFNKNINFVYNQINLSFYLLVSGIALCFLSAVVK